MKKLFLCLLLLVSAFGIQRANAAAAIQDTIIADGYYHICSNYYVDGSAGLGYVYMGDAGAASASYAGWNAIFIGPAEKATANDWNYVWHIWRDAEGKFHMKNCGNQANTYLYPTRIDCAQSDYIFGVGIDHDTYTFRTSDWGSSASASDSWAGVLNRLDRPYSPTAAQITAAIKAGKDTSQLCYDYKKMFFVVPASNRWRWRIGGSSLVKLNSCSSRYGASWWVEPIDMTDKLEWMQLNEAITDAKGQYFEVGENPGYVPESKADLLEAFEETLDEATTMWNEGATVEEYVAETKKVREATEALSAVTNKIDGYYYLRDHYDTYGGGLAKYATFFNDFKYRHVVTSGSTQEDYYADDTFRIKVRTHNWIPEGLWFGYGFVYDADPTAADAQSSALPDKYIWHIQPGLKGGYYVKNCAPSEECQDSTYYYTYIDRLCTGASAHEQFPMCGTPNQGTVFTHVQGNQYWISHTDNWYPLNQGNNYFNTANGTNLLTYCLWELEKVNDERITSKFKLNEAITDAGGLCKGYRWGSNPGEVSEDYITELKAELAKAREVYANPSASDADCDAAAAALKAIYEPTLAVLQDTDNVMNKIVDGYYRFYNTDYIPDFLDHHQVAVMTTSYKASQTVFPPKAVPSGDGTFYDYFSNKDGDFYWEFQSKFSLNEDSTQNVNKNYLPMDIYRTWKITDMNATDANGRELYTVQNLGNGYYLKMPATGETNQVKLVEEEAMVALDNNPQIPQLYNTYWMMNQNMFRNRGWYMLFGKDLHTAMCCNNNVGSNVDRFASANAAKYSAGYNTLYASTTLYSPYFRMQKLEGDVLDSLLAVGEANQRVIHIGTEIARAQAVLDRTVNYTLGDSLITCAGNAVYGDKNGDGIIDTVMYYDREANQIWMNQAQLDEGVHHIAYTDPDGRNHYSSSGLFSYNTLIDGNLASYVQSRWSPSATGGSQAGCTEYNALICDLKDNPQANVVFKLASRGNSDDIYGPLGQRPITYGVTDYGYNYRPTDLRVYATNDTLAGWTEIKLITDIPVIADQRIYTSPLIEAGQPYRFYKVASEGNVSGGHYLGHPHFAPSYFQMFVAEKDEANSPETYIPEVAEKAAALNTAMEAAKAAQAKGEVDEATLTALQEAKEALDEVTPNTWPLLKEYYAAKALADSVYIDESEEEQQYGNVLDGDKDEINEALEAALAQMEPATQATPESIADAIETLKTAEANLTAARKTFEPYKWYYIKATEYQNYHYTKNYAWRGGHLVYACGDIPQASFQLRKMANIASPIRYGHYMGFKDWGNSLNTGAYDQNCPKNNNVTVTYTDQTGTSRTYTQYADYTNGVYDDVASPYAMWRIIPLSDSTYAIQNRANGLYMGRRQDLTASVYNYITLSVEPMPVEINLLGAGQFEILPTDSVCTYYGNQADKPNPQTGRYYSPVCEKGLPLHSQGSDFHMVWWGTGTERGYNTGSAYTFVPIEDEDMQGEDPWLAIPAKENAVQTMSLPYAIDFESMGGVTTDGQSGSAETYVVNSIEGRKVNFEKKEVFEAGEPFILVTGDPSSAVKGEALDSCNLWLDPTVMMDASGNTADLADAFEYSFENKSANGLYAALLGDSILADKSTYNKYGVIADAVGQITDSITDVIIPGHGAYFVMGEIPTDVTANDYEFTFNGNGDFTPGDVNADGKVSVGDLTLLINMIMTEYATQDDAFNAADMNGDGKLSVGDITLIVNTIMNGSKAYVAGTETAATYIDSEKNYITCETPDLEFSEDGATAQLQIGITNAEEITGMQFDLYLPSCLSIAVDKKGRFLKGFTSNERTTADYHTLTINQLSNGAYRFLMYSSSNETIDENSGAVIYCTLKYTDESKPGKVTITAKDITLSNPDGAMAEMAEKVLTENITGINGVTSAKADGTYFNAQGQKTNGAQKGVNIVKYNNGKTVKVVK